MLDLRGQVSGLIHLPSKDLTVTDEDMDSLRAAVLLLGDDPSEHVNIEGLVVRGRVFVAKFHGP